MKKYILPSLKMTSAMLILCCVVYFSIVAMIGKATAGNGDGERLMLNGKVIGYERIGQQFSDMRYFWGRPSAVDYNAAGSAGSNKGATNPDYLQLVKTRLDSFLACHPGVIAKQVPAEMVTASGSGLDPHISPASAYLQASRIAKQRGANVSDIRGLIEQHVSANPIGPDVVNVLKLNLALDALK